MIFLLPYQPVSAQQTPSFALSMPVEYLNYTIVSVNGTLWAKIDGTYPMYVSGDVPESLPMVYPTPPQTVNLSITVDGKQLPVDNYTEAFPYALHHTAIGEWGMVSSVISPVSEMFTLGIHYEHPLQVFNDSNLFLYDLNISPYLSPENNNSTAYFKIRLEANVTNVKASTTETDNKWNSINYTTSQDGAVNVVCVVMHSKYGKPLLGDLVVEVSSPDSIPEYSLLALIALSVATSGGLVVVMSRNKRQKDVG
jgi:hypothetical protein